MYGPHISEIFSGIFPAEKTVGLEKRKYQQFHLFPFFFLVRAVGWHLVSFSSSQWVDKYFLDKYYMCGANTGSGNKTVSKRDQVSIFIILRVSKQGEEQISLIISPDLWTVLDPSSGKGGQEEMQETCVLSCTYGTFVCRYVSHIRRFV